MKFLVVAAIAIVLGVGGLVVLFSDPGADELWIAHLLLVIVYFLLCGAAVGFLAPQRWQLAGLIAWGGFLLGGFIIVAALRKNDSFAVVEPPYISSGLVLLAGPLTLALIGGYIGKLLRRLRGESLS